MASLERTLRKELEKTVKAARRFAEAGASNAIKQLGVGEAEAPKHLTAEQRTLRNRLRAHGRQLGDQRDAKTGVQATTRLVQECAYEHWHRMLFARFLAETDLLIEPDSGVAITLDEVQELAREKGTDWLPLASDYAERMLPQIFRKGDPVLDIALPPEMRSELEDLLKVLATAVFEADDSLGWVYQFWQSDRKDEVNKSEAKIGSEELPAVTQLFTEEYMVLFLLHNTLGAWWAGKVLAGNPELATSAADEAALRAACKIGDIDWTYLRFVRDPVEGEMYGQWRPAAGVFEGWPKAAKDLTVLDPCMGSGHFLVLALPILETFRMAEEGLSQSAAVDAVLRDNLFGLEIDPRCTQIAAFNLAFGAWRKVGYRPLPELNLACSGLAIGVTKAEWLKLSDKTTVAVDTEVKRDLLGVEQNLLTVGLEERVKNGLEALYDLFAKAPWLGSLIEPRRISADIFRESFETLQPLLARILGAVDTDEAREAAVAAYGMSKAIDIMARKFTLITTNLPYLGRKKQDVVFRNYCEETFPDSKTELATCLHEKFTGMLQSGGTVSFVTPQSWFFLKSHIEFRRRLLSEMTWTLVVRLGPKGFQTPMWDFHVAFVSMSNNAPLSNGHYLALDCTEHANPERKSHALVFEAPLLVKQKEQLSSPDSRITFHSHSAGALMGDYAEAVKGLTTGDSNRFVQNFWEQPRRGKGWEWFQTTVSRTCNFGGCHQVFLWEDGKGEMQLVPGSRTYARGAWGSRGVLVSQMGNLPVTAYYGQAYDVNCVVMKPKNVDDLTAIWAFCRSPEFNESIRKIDQALKPTNAAFEKIPFDRDKWHNEGLTIFGDHLPIPATSDPTQWIFSGSAVDTEYSLQVAVSHLLGFNWPVQLAETFPDVLPINLGENTQHVDSDGIVCITALKGEAPAEQRLNALLAEIFDDKWSIGTLTALLRFEGYPLNSLDDWLRDGFFAQHCELFHQRPFIWHIWDGRRDGFHALVNYHRLAAPNGEGRQTLEKLIYSYLGDWIDRQRADQKASVEGADARLAHAEHLKAELIKILEGEPPHDIFVRWKSLHEQPLGWDPDINDGVRMNIRPFMTARTLNARGANACILRTTPKIKWDKDRGKEPTRDKADYPWFWGWDEATADFAGGGTFDGNRWNDLHYSRAVKQAARDRRAVKAGGNK